MDLCQLFWGYYQFFVWVGVWICFKFFHCLFSYIDFFGNSGYLFSLFIYFLNAFFFVLLIFFSFFLFFLVFFHLLFLKKVSFLENKKKFCFFIFEIAFYDLFLDCYADKEIRIEMPCYYSVRFWISNWIDLLLYTRLLACKADLTLDCIVSFLHSDWFWSLTCSISRILKFMKNQKK